MRVHIRTLGPADLGDVAHTARIDQALDLVVSDHPSIEITLDNGAVLTLTVPPNKTDSLSIVSNQPELRIAPRSANGCEIVTPPSA